jgi:hypothetical protein
VAVDRQLLGIYLNDHLAGACAGVGLARRFRASNRGTALGRTLDELVDEIEEDRRTLRDLMRRLGVTPRAYKLAGALAAERLGRLKLNGRLRGYSPLSRLVELEHLVMGIEGKASMWRSLRRIAGAELALDDADLDRLVARAESQQERLERHRPEVTAAALLPGDSPLG